MGFAFFKQHCIRKGHYYCSEQDVDGHCPPYPCLMYEDCQRDARDDKKPEAPEWVDE